MGRLGRLSRRLVPRFVTLSRPYWFSDQKWVARGLLGLLIGLLLANAFALVALNKQTGEFSSALAARDSARYWHSIYLTIALVVLAVPINAFYYFVRDKLTIRWRRWMTHRFLKSYFSNRAFYKLGFRADIDNPDQRIAEDINAFTSKSIYFLLLFAENALTLVAFSVVLWKLSTTLVFVLLVYAAAGTLMTTLVFGRPLVGLNFFQLRREADLRFSLVRIRENAESIAFYQGEDEESKYVKSRFHDVFANFNRLINWQLFLNLFQFAFTKGALIVPTIILAPRVMSGAIEIGDVVQATGAFAAIFNALNIVVEKFDALSQFVAGVGRLDRFASCLESAAAPPDEGEDRIEIVENSPVSLEEVSVQTPDGKRTLVTGLSMALADKDSLMIVGASGGGKSSLLRAFAGLWDTGSGTVVRPPLDSILFLPQRPYMIIGSLREQLLYPGNKKNVSDEDFQKALETVNLPNLMERCGGLDVEADWGKILSLGEQQRLALARVLLAERPYVILDEATSALDQVNEEKFYELLKGTDVTMISVSHRPHVAKYHTHVLVLAGDETWELVPSGKYDGAERNGKKPEPAAKVKRAGKTPR